MASALRPKLSYSTSAGVLPIENLSLAGTVDLLTQDVLATLRRRCTGVYAAFATVIDRLRVLSHLLLDREGLETVVEGDETILALLNQLSRSHIATSALESESDRAIAETSSVRAVLQAPSRSQLALQAHERVDDFIKVFLPTETVSDWRAQWERDCNEQCQYCETLLETAPFKRAVNGLPVHTKRGMIQELQSSLDAQGRLSPQERRLLQLVLSQLRAHKGQVDEPDPGDRKSVV